MRTSEIAMRSFKTRLYSWLTMSTQGCLIRAADGTPALIAVYHNGRYIEPDFIKIGIPDDLSTLGSPGGPDGPPIKEEDEDEPE